MEEASCDYNYWQSSDIKRSKLTGCCICRVVGYWITRSSGLKVYRIIIQANFRLCIKGRLGTSAWNACSVTIRWECLMYKTVYYISINSLSLPWRISLYYMAPEWVGDVMNRAIGWLLDITIERNVATLWIKTTQGGILRLADRYRPCFYILSRNGE